ncbi:hypothetical protein FOZ63_023215, partial [Perkinsus olseni]
LTLPVDQAIDRCRHRLTEEERRFTIAIFTTMKQRFTSIDVRAMVRSIRPRLLGAKVANIYDINNKLYILKFTSATASQDTDETTENKWFLVLEAGVRFNLTEYDRG